jgi:MtfA peptidase
VVGGRLAAASGVGLIGRWQRWREARRVARHAIPDALWSATLARFPFLQQADDPVRLRRMASLFLSSKEFHGAGGLQFDDAMAVAVAAQACLPVLHLGLGLYDGSRTIVLHPAEVLAPRVDADERGLVHEWDEELAGEALQGGPLMLAWSAVEAGAAPTAGEPVFNVVIHEFVHLIDMANGEADGVPPLPSAQAAARWHEDLSRAWDRFGDRIAHREPSCIDAYGNVALEEFFAVASEAYFVAPAALEQEDPQLHAQLRAYFNPG